MKTEELEQSLRAEFEGQLKNAIAKMREDVESLQKNYESEFEKHRTQMDEAFKALSGKLDEPFEFDRAFSESVSEHLRLARDEGALVTATAMGEAEKLAGPSQSQDFEKLRNSINEIKGNSTQAAILRALVDAASNFAPRGAFFIVKNDHLVGWKVFGGSEFTDENAVRSIHFPISENTLVTNALASLSASSGNYSDQPDNAKFLGPLSFGAPDEMVAIPLVARGRGVAVLYVDGGEADTDVNREALETLVSVAGLRVELLASATAPAPAEPVNPTVVKSEESEAASEYQNEPSAVEAEAVANAAETTAEEEYVGDVEVAVVEATEVSEFDVTPEVNDEPEAEQDPVEPSEQSTDFALSPNNFADASPVSSEQDAYDDEESVEEVSSEPEQDVEEKQNVRSYRERTVDLPIDVSEEERRPHSDARRFARLLVSEIRLYNEQKVVEGRESGDIYEMLKEAIDRSREMYEKRVQPDVAAKFDYFHYELVNNLAEGDEEKLGAGYFAVKA